MLFIFKSGLSKSKVIFFCFQGTWGIILHSLPCWIYHLPGIHGQQANHRPAGSNWDPPLDPPAFPISLVSGNSDFEYVYPFYYGLVGENAFIMMFEKTGRDAEIRFAQSPDGGGEKNPAWDFIYFRRNYRVGRNFRFRACGVYKKFEGVDDVVRIYENWSGRKVARPRSQDRH